MKYFALKDLQGVSHSLADLQDVPVVVVAFMGVECPLARLYAPRLSELAGEFAELKVAFLAIDANAQDSLAEMEHFARTYKLTIPFLKDPGSTVADQFAAERTPEVFVLDRERKMRYRGRIDDQYGFQSGVGYQRPTAVKRDLASAVAALLSGKPVAESRTRAPGCLIGRAGIAKEHSEVTFSRQIARVSRSLRPMSSRRRNCTLQPEQLRRGCRLGTDDQRSRLRKPNASLARRSKVRSFRQRLPAYRRRKANDRYLGCERCPARRPCRFAGTAKIHGRMANFNARPNYHHERTSL